MRPIITLLLMMCFILANVNVNAQNASKKPVILHEMIGDKYEVVKATSENMEIIFRGDRIEVLEKAHDGNNEVMSTLFLDGSNPAIPEFGTQVKEYARPIDNPAMGEVLKAKHIDVVEYEQITFKNIYDQTDMVVTIVGDALDFELINKSQKAIPFKLRSWDHTNLQIKGDKAFLNKHQDLELKLAASNSVMTEEGQLALSPAPTKDANTNLNFQMILN